MQSFPSTAACGSPSCAWLWSRQHGPDQLWCTNSVHSVESAVREGVKNSVLAVHTNHFLGLGLSEDLISSYWGSSLCTFRFKVDFPLVAPVIHPAVIREGCSTVWTTICNCKDAAAVYWHLYTARLNYYGHHGYHTGHQCISGIRLDRGRMIEVLIHLLHSFQGLSSHNNPNIPSLR